jgi:phosphatidylserine/phosphatidylglycerophosphate/cardiolipin synthase-like enzyme
MAIKKTRSTDINAVIRKNLNGFRKPGVLTVRPGFEIRNHQYTGKPAIVVTVHTKKNKADLARGEALPESIGAIPVDVREARPYQRLRAEDPASAEIAMNYGRQELHEPVWPGELEMPSGKPLASKPPESHPELAQAAARRPAKPEIGYKGPDGFSLSEIDDTMTITTAVSPDCGFQVLEDFLNQTNSSLVIAMYDFTSGPILALFEKVLAGGQQLQLVLDHPSLNPTNDQSDDETVQALQEKLGGRFKFNWALVRSDSHVNAWVFPFAYHIKVIVRDDSAVWLSSGNLNNSNEPDPNAPTPKTEDRDWHVVIESEQLAKLFSAFITNDFNTASGHQVDESAALRSAISRSMLMLAENTNPPPAEPIVVTPAAKTNLKPRTLKDQQFKITPLLTPDKVDDNPDPNAPGQYMTQMLALINSAQQSLDFQLQYIEVPKDDTGGNLKDLLLAVKALVDKGVKVRVIQNGEFGEKWAEMMLSMADIDLTPVMKMQPNVHNKGFIIDAKKVVVSSQNWSPSGIFQNRDAGLIIESEAIAQYFGKVFDADWDNATPFNPTAAKAVGRAPQRRPSPRR